MPNRLLNNRPRMLSCDVRTRSFKLSIYDNTEQAFCFFHPNSTSLQHGFTISQNRKMGDVLRTSLNRNKREHFPVFVYSRAKHRPLTQKHTWIRMVSRTLVVGREVRRGTRVRFGIGHPLVHHGRIHRLGLGLSYGNVLRDGRDGRLTVGCWLHWEWSLKAN